MKIYVVRHGETEYSALNKYADISNIPLNMNGEEQAKKLRDEIEKLNIDIIISSPLIRAAKTAEIINERMQKKLVLSDFFAERNVGVYEGKTKEEAESQYPEMAARNCTRQLDDAPLGGETIREFERRVLMGVKEIMDQYKGQNVLIVCHGFVARILNKYFNQLDYDEMYNYVLKHGVIEEYTV